MNTKDIAIHVGRVAGAILNGNLAGLRWNVVGAKQRRQHRGSFDSANLSAKERDLVAEFKRVGYVSLGYPFSSDVIDLVAEEFRAMLSQGESIKRHNKQSQEAVGYSFDLKDPVRQMPVIKQLMIEDVTRFVSGVYQAHCRPVRVSAWRNCHVPPDVAQSHEVYSDRWHCDSKPTSQLKLFIFLTDVTEDHGPFVIMSRRATWWHARKALLRIPDSRWFRLPPKEVKVSQLAATGNKGLTLLANTEQCLHRATIPAPGKIRDVVQFVFEPASQEMGVHWEEHVPQEAIHQV